MSQEKLCLHPKELAEAMGIGYTTALQMMKKPGFPVLKIGSKRLVPIELLKKWMIQQTEMN